MSFDPDLPSNFPPLSPIAHVASISSRGSRTANNYKKPFLTSGPTSKQISELQEMLNDLQLEQQEYIKTKKVLEENNSSYSQTNKTLKEAINERKEYYKEIINRYKSSNEKLLSAQNKNHKIAQLNQAYKIRVDQFNRIEKERQKSSIQPEELYEQEVKKSAEQIQAIENKGNKLMEKYPIEENKIRNYKVLISLLQKLLTINNLFSKEATNLIESSNVRTNQDLQNKVMMSNQIKLELNLLNRHRINPPIPADQIDDLVKEMQTCSQTHNKIHLISKQNNVIQDNDMTNFDTSSVFSVTEPFSARENRMKFEFPIDLDSNLLSPIEIPPHKKFYDDNDIINREIELNEEIEALKIIIGYPANNRKYGYLSNSKSRSMMMDQLEQNFLRANDIASHHHKVQKKSSFEISEPKAKYTSPRRKKDNQNESPSYTPRCTSQRRIKREITIPVPDSKERSPRVKKGVFNDTPKPTQYGASPSSRRSNRTADFDEDKAEGILFVEPYGGVLIIGNDKEIIEVDGKADSSSLSRVYSKKKKNKKRRGPSPKSSGKLSVSSLSTTNSSPVDDQQLNHESESSLFEPRIRNKDDQINSENFLNDTISQQNSDSLPIQEVNDQINNEIDHSYSFDDSSKHHSIPSRYEQFQQIKSENNLNDNEDQNDIDSINEKGHENDSQSTINSINDKQNDSINLSDSIQENENNSMKDDNEINSQNQNGNQDNTDDSVQEKEIDSNKGENDLSETGSQNQDEQSRDITQENLNDLKNYEEELNEVPTNVKMIPDDILINQSIQFQLENDNLSSGKAQVEFLDLTEEEESFDLYVVDNRTDQPPLIENIQNSLNILSNSETLESNLMKNHIEPNEVSSSKEINQINSSNRIEHQSNSNEIENNQIIDSTQSRDIADSHNSSKFENLDDIQVNDSDTDLNSLTIKDEKQIANSVSHDIEYINIDQRPTENIIQINSNYSEAVLNSSTMKDDQLMKNSISNNESNEYIKIDHASTENQTKPENEHESIELHSSELNSLSTQSKYENDELEQISKSSTEQQQSNLDLDSNLSVNQLDANSLKTINSNSIHQNSEDLSDSDQMNVQNQPKFERIFNVDASFNVISESASQTTEKVYSDDPEEENLDLSTDALLGDTKSSLNSFSDEFNFPQDTLHVRFNLPPEFVEMMSNQTKPKINSYSSGFQFDVMTQRPSLSSCYIVNASVQSESPNSNEIPVENHNFINCQKINIIARDPDDPNDITDTHVNSPSNQNITTESSTINQSKPLVNANNDNSPLDQMNNNQCNSLVNDTHMNRNCTLNQLNSTENSTVVNDNGSLNQSNNDNTLGDNFGDNLQNKLKYVHYVTVDIDEEFPSAHEYDSYSMSSQPSDAMSSSSFGYQDTLASRRHVLISRRLKNRQSSASEINGNESLSGPFQFENLIENNQTIGSETNSHIDEDDLYKEMLDNNELFNSESTFLNVEEAKANLIDKLNTLMDSCSEVLTESESHRNNNKDDQLKHKTKFDVISDELKDDSNKSNGYGTENTYNSPEQSLSNVLDDANSTNLQELNGNQQSSLNDPNSVDTKNSQSIAENKQSLSNVLDDTNNTNLQELNDNQQSLLNHPNVVDTKNSQSIEENKQSLSNKIKSIDVVPLSDDEENENESRNSSNLTELNDPNHLSINDPSLNSNEYNQSLSTVINSNLPSDDNKLNDNSNQIKSIDVVPVSDDEDESRSNEIGTNDENPIHKSTFKVSPDDIHSIDENDDNQNFDKSNNLLTPLDEGAGNSICSDVSSAYKIRNNSSKSNYDDNKGKRIKYRLKIQHFLNSGHKEILEKTRIESNTSNNDSNKPSQLNDLDDSNKSKSRDVDNTKSDPSLLISEEEKVKMKQQLNLYKNETSNLSRQLHLVKSSCTDLLSQIEILNFKRNIRRIESCTSVLTIEPETKESPILLADAPSQTDLVDLDSVDKQINATETLMKIRPKLESNLTSLQEIKKKLARKLTNVTKDVEALKDAEGKFEQKLKEIRPETGQFISPATRKRIQIERKVEQRKQQIVELEKDKKLVQKDHRNVQNKILDLQCVHDMLKKKIQAQLKMPKQNVALLIKNLQGYRNKEKDNKEKLKLIKIEENSLTKRKKELELINSAEKQTLIKEIEDLKEQICNTEQRFHRILEARKHFASVRKSSTFAAMPAFDKSMFPTDSHAKLIPQSLDVKLINRNEFTELESREEMLDTYLKENDEQREEIMKSIVNMIRALSSAQIPVPNWSFVKLNQ